MVVKPANIVLYSILVSGALLRILRFPPIWVTDSARDLLMGLHIAWFHQLPRVGHWALGSSFPYPPYYYYFLGLLTYISSHLSFIFGVFVFVQLLGVLALYKIGALLFSKKTGLLAAFFYSFSAVTVISGSMIETVFFNVPIFLYSFYTFILFYKTKRMFFAFVSLFFILISVSIHASSIPFLFLYAVVTVYRLRKEKMQKIILLITLFSAMSIIFFFPVIRLYGLQGFLTLLFQEGKTLSGNNIFFTFLSNWGELLRFLLFSHIQAIIFFVISVIVQLYLLFRHNSKKIKGLAICGFCIGYLLAAISITQKEIYLHYFSLGMPFVFLAVAHLLVENFKSASSFVRSVTLSVMAVMLFIFLKTPNESVYWVTGDAHTYEKLADTVIADVADRQKVSSERGNDFYQVFVVTPYDDYKNSFLVWYFLEKKYQQKLIKISNSRSDFIPINDARVIYVVCDLRSVQDFGKACLEKFSQKNPSKKYEGFLKRIDKDYTLHVFTT